MKKTIVVVLAVGLVATSLGVTAQAKKKKKPKPKPAAMVPASVDFYLRAADCSAEVFGLSIENGEGDGTCGGFDQGAVNEVAGTAGEPYVGHTWMALDGLPLVLDATKPLTGKIYTTSWAGPSAGPATLDVTISAEVDGASTEIGTATVDYMVTPAGMTSEVAFEIDVPDLLEKKTITGLTMTTVSRGLAPVQGYYEMEDPASFITLPALVAAA